MRRGLLRYLRISKRTLRNHPGMTLAVFLTGLLLPFVAISILIRSSPGQYSGNDAINALQETPGDAFGLSPGTSAPRAVIFPYSVVPGGVHNAQEVKQAVARDPTVAKHYAVLNLEKLHLIHVSKASAVYVSYRKGSNIYWTQRKLTLAPGESLLTDGENMVRVRCGNLVSPSPKPPNSPEEPTPVTFDTPLIPPPPATMPPLVLTSNPGRVFFPPFVPLFPGDGPGKHHHGPPVHIPEPSTLVMLLSGFALLWAVSKGRSQ